MGAEKRRHDRFYADLPVEVRAGSRRIESHTVDVSYGGLFLCSEDPPPLRQLVTLKIMTLERPGGLEVMAMPVFIDRRGTAGCPGFGVKLFGLDPDTRKSWETTVARIRTQPDTRVVPHRPDGAGAPPPEVATPSPEPDEAYREPTWMQVLPEFVVRLRTADDLRSFRFKDLSRGRVYVRTDRVLEEGSHVEVRVIHPIHDAVFVIGGIMDKVVRRPDFKGVRIRLEELEHVRRDEFELFAQTGEAPPSEQAG